MAKTRKPRKTAEPTRHIGPHLPLSYWRRLNKLKTRTGKSFKRLFAEILDDYFARTNIKDD